MISSSVSKGWAKDQNTCFFYTCFDLGFGFFYDCLYFFLGYFGSVNDNIYFDKFVNLCEVADVVRGMLVNEASSTLLFLKKSASLYVRKALMSSVAMISFIL